LAPLRYVRSITAPLSPLQARRFASKFGVVVLNGYGQAAIGEVLGWTAADAREHPDKLGAVGRPHPGVSIKIAGAAAEPTGPEAIADRPTDEGGAARATNEGAAAEPTGPEAIADRPTDEGGAARATNEIGRLLV